MSRRISRPDGDIDARALVEELRAQLRDIQGALRPETPTKTLADLASDWLPRKLRKLRSRDSFEGRVRNYLLPVLGVHTEATLRPKHIEKMMGDLVDSGLGKQTVNHVRDAGRQLVEDAITNESWKGGNPFLRVKPFKIRRPKQDRLSAEECYDFLRWIPRKWRPMFAIAIYLGPRRGEIFDLKRVDVDIVRRRIRFSGSKTDTPREDVPIPEELVPYLEEQLMRGPYREWLFTNRYGGQFSPDTKALNRVLREAIENADIRRGEGYPKLSFKSLRLISSTLHQEAGCASWVVSKILGHSQASLIVMGNPPENTTARFYSEYSFEFCRTEINKLTLGPAI